MSQTEYALKALGKMIDVGHKDIKSFIVKNQCDRTNNNFNVHEKKIMYLNKRIVENSLQIKSLSKTNPLKNVSVTNHDQFETIENKLKEYSNKIIKLENNLKDYSDKIRKLEENIEEKILKVIEEKSQDAEMLPDESINIEEENIENVENIEEKIQDAEMLPDESINIEEENIEEVENVEDVENIEEVENVENVENIEEVENIENIENVENVENVENIEDIENLEN